MTSSNNGETTHIQTNSGPNWEVVAVQSARAFDLNAPPIGVSMARPLRCLPPQRLTRPNTILPLPRSPPGTAAQGDQHLDGLKEPGPPLPLPRPSADRAALLAEIGVEHPPALALVVHLQIPSFAPVSPSTIPTLWSGRCEQSQTRPLPERPPLPSCSAAALSGREDPRRRCIRR